MVRAGIRLLSRRRPHLERTTGIRAAPQHVAVLRCRHPAIVHAFSIRLRPSDVDISGVLRGNSPHAAVKLLVADVLIGIVGAGPNDAPDPGPSANVGVIAETDPAVFTCKLDSLQVNYRRGDRREIVFRVPTAHLAHHDTAAAFVAPPGRSTVHMQEFHALGSCPRIRRHWLTE